MDRANARPMGKRWKREDLDHVKVFLDTDIIVYSLDQADAGKRGKCRGLIKESDPAKDRSHQPRLRQEFYVAATAKLGADPLLIKDILRCSGTV